MFKKILFVMIVMLFIGCDFDFTNKTADIPSGSSVGSAVIDTSTFAPDSNVWNFIQQFNALNTDTTCSIRHIVSEDCSGGYELGHYTKIYVICESLINYSFPQKIDIFAKRFTRTDPIIRDSTRAVYSVTTYTNEHCVPNPEKN